MKSVFPVYVDFLKKGLDVAISFIYSLRLLSPEIGDTHEFKHV